MGFEMRGDHQEILTIIDNLNSLGRAFQTGTCENIDGDYLASVLDEARAVNARMDAQTDLLKTQPDRARLGYTSCTRPFQDAQQNLVRNIMNGGALNNTNKGRIAVEIVKLISHMPEVICDTVTERIDLVKLENTFRAIHRAFCGGDLV